MMTTTMDKRPWPVDDEVWAQCMKLFPKWLKERGGIVVYENHVLDSSQRGHTTFMPMRYQAKDDTWHDAPARIGDVPSRFEERVDTIMVEQFGGDMDRCLSACFKYMPPAPPPKAKRKRR